MCYKQYLLQIRVYCALTNIPVSFCIFFITEFRCRKQLTYKKNLQLKSHLRQHIEMKEL